MSSPTRRAGGFPGPLLTLTLILCVGCFARPLPGAEAVRRPFALAAGGAEATLEAFSVQADVPVVFPLREVRGVATNPVHGDFAPREALQRLVAGTGLEVKQDGETGSFVVRREHPAVPPQDSVQTNKSPPVKKPAFLSLLAGWLAFAPTDGAAQAASTPAKEEAVVLSPFEVNTNRDVGFVATTSLAGGRLAGDLVDTPVAYSVQTREFLDALNITDLNEALDWTVNATTTPDDGGGQLFGGTGGTTIRGVSSNTVNRNFFAGGGNPSSYNMERMDYARGPNSALFGTGSISGTANVVLKSARLGQNRNEVRLEAESWGGVRATVDLNHKLGEKAAVRLVGTWQDTNTWRDWENTRRKGLSPSLTYQLAKNTKLTVISEFYEQERTAGHVALNDSFSGWDGVKTYSGLQPANLPTQTPFGASRIGTNVLVWSPASGVRENVVMSYTGLMQTQGYSGQRPVNGVTAPIPTGLYSGSPILDMPATPAGLYDAAVQGTNGRFQIPSRSFTNIGPNTTSTDAFRDVTFYLDQRLGQDVNVQLSGGKNRRESYGLVNYYLNQGYQNTFIDINQLLPNGAQNPNFLQPYNEFSRQERAKNKYDNQALRLAVAYMKDFRWVDVKTNVMAGAEEQMQFSSREYYMLPVDPDPRAWGLINTNRTQTIRYRYYWNQQERSMPEFDQVTVTDPIANTSTDYKPLWVLASDRTDATMLRKSETKYYQAAANLAFFKKRLILLGAYRSDTVDRSQQQFMAAMDHPSATPITRESFLYRPEAPADYWQLRYVPKNANGVPTSPDVPAVTRPRTNGNAQPQHANDRFPSDYNPPAVKTTADTMAIGGIVNIGKGFSLWANYAETFNPANLGRTTIDFGTPGSSLSKGFDVGIRYSLGPKFYATLSRYESKEGGAETNAPAGSTNIQMLIETNALNDLRSDGRNIRDVPDVPVSWSDKFDRLASGYEMELVANLTKSWRSTLNFGLADASQTNAWRETREYTERHDGVFRQILNDAGIEVGSDNVARGKTGVTTANSPDLIRSVNAWNNLTTNRANWITGEQPLNRLTKYTANFFTDYRFSESRLKGLRLGYGMQFRGKQVIGYRGPDSIVNPSNPAQAIDDPTVDATTPVYQKPYYLATATIGYPLQIAGLRPIALNLSISNLFDYDEPLFNTSGIRPTNGDLSTRARTSYGRNYSYVTPRSYRLSATYTF